MQDCSDEEEKALYDGLQSFSTLPLSAPADEKLLDGYNKVTQSIYIKLVSVETLLIHYSDAIPPFRQRIDGKLSTAPLFTNSLRRLFIPRWRDSDDSREKRLSAKNVAWILTFSPSLVEACLSFSVSISDFNHLREHETALYGLSNVRRLALEFYFTFNEAEKSSWWGSPSENRESWKGGNKKMHAIWVLLSLTKNLTSLELYQSLAGLRSGDKTEVYSTCLSSLTSSFGTLRHLRILNIGSDPTNPPLAYEKFKQLRTLSTDHFQISHLAKFNDIKLPTSLETIFLVYHVVDPSPVSFQPPEELELTSLIKNRELPNLRQVIIPLVPIDQNGDPQTSPAFLRRSELSREALEKMLKSEGNVKLRKIGKGVKGETIDVQVAFLCSFLEFQVTTPHFYDLTLYLSFPSISLQSEILPKENYSCQAAPGFVLHRLDLLF